MHLVVLGASGGVGRQLVLAAQQRGHQVTAVARASSELPDVPGVRVVRGDLTDAAFLADTLRAADAVLSGLGLRMPGILPWHKPEDATFASRSAVAIVAAMQRAQVRRILAVSAGGVGDSFEAVPGVFRGMIRWTGLRHAYADLERMEKIYADSGLDWCAPRPTGLTDGPATGKVVIAPSFTGRATISRADVAGWMLDEVVRKTIKVRTPMITVTGAS